MKLLCSLLTVVRCLASETSAQPGLFSLTGVVVDQNDAVVAKARVVVRGADRQQRSTATDVSGAFRFERLVAGDYDWQNYFEDHNNLAPRFSFAYPPDQSRKTVIRGGFGLFYDRTGPGPISEVLRFDGERLRRYVIINPCFPNPLCGGQTLTAQPTSIVRLAPGVIIPTRRSSAPASNGSC